MKNLTKKHKVALIIGVLAFLANLLTGHWLTIEAGLCLLALILIYTDKVKLSRITYGVALIIYAYSLRWFIAYPGDILHYPSLFLPFITIVIALIYTKKINTGLENQNNTLSNNYSILKTFQWLVGILTIVSIIIFIVFMVEHGDKLPEEQLFYTIVLFALQVFLSICVILIVKFLFDLDRYKSNYTITDKGKSQYHDL
jgi:hypothetical protein